MLISPSHATDAPGRRPVLSLCIPTYNRSECLDSLLASLEAAVMQLSVPLRAGLEVLISDNASSDATAHTVARHLPSLPNARAWVNPQNLGAEGNFRLLLAQARGQFVWLLGDDDRLLPNALSSVLPCLAPETGLVLLNYSVWDGGHERVVRANGRGLASDECIDSQLLMRHHGVHLAYISSCILNHRLLTEPRLDVYDRLAPHGFAFLYLAYSGLLRTRLPANVLAQVVLENRVDPQVRYNWFHYFVRGSTMALHALRREGYRRRDVAAARRGLVWEFLIPRIGVMAQKGSLPRSWLLRYCSQCYWDLGVFWFVLLPVLLMPARGLRGVRRLWLLLRRYWGTVPRPEAE